MATKLPKRDIRYGLTPVKCVAELLVPRNCFGLRHEPGMRDDQRRDPSG
jgi:hypothetical protein